MTFVRDFPQGPPPPINQRAQLVTNFDQYATIFGNNHTAMNFPKQGDHETVIIEKRANNPSISQDLVALFCKDAPSNLGTQPQLFFKIPKFLPSDFDTTTADNTAMQLTYNTVNVAGPVYQSFLVGGYLFYFGQTTNIAVNIVLSPAPTKILIAIANPNNRTNAGTFTPYNVSTQIINNTDFKINSTLNAPNPTPPYSFTWLAIGSV